MMHADALAGCPKALLRACVQMRLECRGCACKCVPFGSKFLACMRQYEPERLYKKLHEAMAVCLLPAGVVMCAHTVDVILSVVMAERLYYTIGQHCNMLIV